MANQRQRDDVGGGQRNGLLQQVFQLPHIAGPGGGQNRGLGIGGECGHRFAITGCNLFQEMCCQQRDVFAALRQRRQLQRDDVQPIKQIFTKGALSTHLIEIAMGGRNDAHINIDRLRRADRSHRTVLQHAQQFGLERERHVANLIEKQAAAVGRLKQALLRCGCPGERAFGITEKLALQQLLGNGRAVDGQERLAGSTARGVNRARQQFFAGTRFT